MYPSTYFDIWCVNFDLALGIRSLNRGELLSKVFHIDKFISSKGHVSWYKEASNVV